MHSRFVVECWWSYQCFLAEGLSFDALRQAVLRQKNQLYHSKRYFSEGIVLCHAVSLIGGSAVTCTSTWPLSVATRAHLSKWELSK